MDSTDPGRLFHDYALKLSLSRDSVRILYLMATVASHLLLVTSDPHETALELLF